MAATFENIMDRVEHCYTAKPCVECKYDKRDFPHCVGRLLSDVRFFYKLLESRLTQVERERDAAFADINRCCGTCKHFQNEEDDCTAEECIGSGSYMEPSGWEWRGVGEENTEEG